MTDLEFEILDELYFVKRLEDLQKELFSLGNNLLPELENLIKKGWVRILDGEDNEIQLSDKRYKNYESSFKYIATKQGLKAHNQV